MDLIVMNDSMGTGQHGGSHWSLIAIDREHKVTRYYDSLRIGDTRQIALAGQISAGLVDILGENFRADWSFAPEYDSPAQRRHNKCGDDAGPCGPFVYYMARMLVRYIKERQRSGQEQGSSLTLSAAFPAHFVRRWRFDSLLVRIQMQQSIQTCVFEQSMMLPHSAPEQSPHAQTEADGPDDDMPAPDDIRRRRNRQRRARKMRVKIQAP